VGLCLAPSLGLRARAKAVARIPANACVSPCDREIGG
jgi:hypothetical protein